MLIRGLCSDVVRRQGLAQRAGLVQVERLADLAPGSGVRGRGHDRERRPRRRAFSEDREPDSGVPAVAGAQGCGSQAVGDDHQAAGPDVRAARQHCAQEGNAHQERGRGETVPSGLAIQA